MSRGGSNPFLGLFGESSMKVTLLNKEEQEEEDIVTALAEDIFHLTIKREVNSDKHLVYLEDLASQSSMNLVTLKMAIFERLLLDDPVKALLPSKNPPSAHVIQRDCLLYLFECYRQIYQNNSTHIHSKILSYVVGNAATALWQPSLFELQNVHRQVVDLFEAEDENEVRDFLNRVVEVILKEDDSECLKDAFNPVLGCVQQDFTAATVLTFPRRRFNLLYVFATHPHLSQILVDFTMPMFPIVSLSYVDSLLGAILNLSCLPKTVDRMVEYFEKPLDGALSSLESSLWVATGELIEKAGGVLEALCRRADARAKVLKWLGGCLDASLPRGRMWGAAEGYPSDGFALNLASLLLRLARPLSANNRLLKIDPTYSSAEEELECVVKSLRKEPCLQPANEGPPRPVPTQPYSFLTQIFHLTHRALDLSVRVVIEKTQVLYQEIGQLQQTLSEAQTQIQPRPQVIEAFRQRMEIDMSRYLCQRCALLEPNLVDHLGEFCVATSEWIVQVLLDDDTTEDRASYAPLTARPLAFPLPPRAPQTFRCIPELMVENIVRYLRLASTYSPQSLERGGRELLDPLLTLLLVMMGSNKRARNPHLRAQLAQALESLLPRDSDRPSLNPNPLGVFYRQQLFLHHKHKLQIVECLLQVFVSIEMTGQSVAFEQKFNYRRPMYIVMDYLWGIPCHREVFKSLAKVGEEGMEEVTPPLFLRFINLLMNDAVFLLDEALANMAQLRNMQTARDNGEWEELPIEERERNEQYLRQIGMTARFDNILGKETIHTLEYMSSEIKSIFCHSTMVDRIAAMLNYFLYHLVGPKKKNLKVKDLNEYKFEPGGIVLDICRIYIHLGSSNEFCSAVSRDGRSYSPQLFTLALHVLGRIGGLDLVGELGGVGSKVEKLASEQRTEEEILSEVPEEFLDPIMSTLMTDPVTLPSSRITLDRSTIARHLLSDQTDPFNRSPLTMNMVESNCDLKEAIEKWVAEKKSQRGQDKR